MASTAFLGSPAAAVPSLRVLVETTDVRAVVTRPARRRGRGRHTLRTPVAEEADALGLAVHTPGSRAELAALDFAVDLAVVVAFGMIIPAAQLVVPRRGFVNVHFSLLPAWRGAAPVERAILAGDRETGVCLMQMDEGLDTGGVIACASRPTNRQDAGTLTSLLADDGADLLRGRLEGILAGEALAVPQVGEASYASRLRSEEGRLDPNDPGDDLDRRVRAFTPRPGAWLETEAGRLKVWKAELADSTLPPGEWRYDGAELTIGTGGNALRLLEVQAEGSRRMDAGAWANGHRGALPALVR